jgi:hypothetical protein
MLIKIRDGTPLQEGESLCNTCSNARIIRGRRADEELVLCDAVIMQPVRVTFKVTSCGAYSDDSLPPYQELVEKAWILHPRRSKGRTAGFVRGADLTMDERIALFRSTKDSG